MSPRHVPVLLAEVLRALAPADGEVIVDATFGAGGYTRALLAAADVRVVALDRDPAAIAAGACLAAAHAGRLTLIHERFSQLSSAVTGAGYSAVHGVVLDVGVSSMQLDEAERGFSFMADGPLDMRMGADGPTAADVVNSAEAEELAEILWLFGEERRSRAIARAIVARRRTAPFTRTRDLARLIEGVAGPGAEPGKHPATRTFQALRIHVNNELIELQSALVQAESMLSPGGRLVAVTFHSLEDRIVKAFLRARTGAAPLGSRHLPDPGPRPAPSFRFVNQRALSPTEEEVRANPRARSARLRWAVRTEAPAWGPDAIDAVPRIGRRLGSKGGR